jgi:hypothetical protein
MGDTSWVAGNALFAAWGSTSGREQPHARSAESAKRGLFPSDRPAKTTSHSSREVKKPTDQRPDGAPSGPAELGSFRQVDPGISFQVRRHCCTTALTTHCVPRRCCHTHCSCHLHRATTADSRIPARLPCEVQPPPDTAASSSLTVPLHPGAPSPTSAQNQIFPTVRRFATYPATWIKPARIRKFTRRGTASGYNHTESGEVLGWNLEERDAQEQQRRLWLNQQPRLPRSPYSHVEKEDHRPIFTPQPTRDTRGSRASVRGLISRGCMSRSSFTEIMLDRNPALGKQLRVGLTFNQGSR